MSITTTLKRSARSVLDQRKDGQHWRTFQEHRPKLADIAPEVERAADGLRDEYERYTSTVSIPEAAVSLETAALLVVLCRRLNVRTALDLGSGFSSWVLAAKSTATVSKTATRMGCSLLVNSCVISHSERRVRRTPALTGGASKARSV